MRRYLDQKLRLHYLRVIDALEIHGSLLKASVALGVSQPALTKTLRDLEDLVGTQLFERHTRGVRPTSSGMVMVRSSRRILAELRRTEEDLDHLTNPFGGIAAIGALPVAASGLAPMIVSKLRSEKNDLRVRIEEGRTEELLPLLAAGQIDLIVGRFYEPSTGEAFAREQLWNDPLAIVARVGHPLIREPSTDMADWSAFELVLPVAPQRVAAEIDGLLDPLGLADTPTIWSTSYGFTREILLSSDAYTILPPMVMLGDIVRGALAAAPLPIPPAIRPAGIITLQGRPLNAAAATFIECLRADISLIVETHLSQLLGDASGAG